MQSSIATRMSRAALQGLFDQALWSLASFGVTFMAARSLDSHAFGAFSLAFAAHLFVLGLSRAITSECLVLDISGATEEEWRSGLQQAAGTAVCLGVVAAAGAVAVGTAWKGSAGASLVAMGIFFPGLLLQDLWRFAFFAVRRGEAACINDLVRAAGMSVGLVAATWTAPSAPSFALIVGASGAVAGLVGMAQVRAVPRLSGAGEWLTSRRHLACYFAGQFLIQTGSAHVVLLLIAGLAGLAAVGGIRAAQILLGPVHAAIASAGLFAIPEGVRQRRGGGVDAVCRIGLRVSVGLLAVVSACTAVAALTPHRIGEAILRENWAVARAFLAPVAVAAAATAVATGAATVLRGLGDARKGLWGGAFQGLFGVVAAGVGAALADGQGAAWGIAASAIAACVVWWGLCARALRDAGSEASLRGVLAPSAHWET
jgi:O-antigen/teichoic acid export membrane protein